MATFKVKSGVGKYHDSSAYDALNQYVASSQKTREGGVIGASILPEIAAEAMQAVTRAYHKEDGVKLRHSILSFDPNERISFQEARVIAEQVMDFFADDYQILAAIHENQDNLHIHFLMNVVNYHDGSKYRGTKKNYYNSLKHVQNVTRKFGVNTFPVKDED